MPTAISAARRFTKSRTVQTKCLHRRTSSRRQTDKASRVRQPREMLFPALRTRMKQSRGKLGHGIHGTCPCEFVIVTALAGQGEIACMSGASFAAWNEVLY